jgi:hypothetical protein
MGRFRSEGIVGAGFVAFCLSCSGSIGGGPGGPGSGPGPGPGPGNNGNGNGGSPGAPADPNAAGPLPLQRLTNREYNNTVRDLLGDISQPAGQFASDRDTAFEFRQAGDVAVQDATLLQTAAASLAAAAVPRLVPGRLLPCDPASGEEACARMFLAT